jgi:hypothetical protein
MSNNRSSNFSGCFIPSTATPEKIRGPGITPTVAEFVQIFSVTTVPPATEKPLPSETPTPTDTPMPAVPKSVITSSLGLINTTPVKDEKTGDWVIVDLKQNNPQIFLRWDNKSSEWLDERPLYWQCGRSIAFFQNEYDPSVPEDVKSLPTGILVGKFYGPLEGGNGTKVELVRACITKVYEAETNPVLGMKDLIKAALFDLKGEPHEYNVGISSKLIDGRDEWISYCDQNSCFSKQYEEEINFLDNFYYYLSPFATRQIDMQKMTQNPGNFWGNEENFSKNKALTLQVIEAIRTGKDFPDEVPSDFVLWSVVFSFIGGDQQEN